MSREDAQSIIRACRRQLAWGIREHISPDTLGYLEVDDYHVDVDSAPVLIFQVTLKNLITIRPTRMTMQLTYLEGIEVFDMFTFYYDAGGIFQGHLSSQGIRVGTLDDFLIDLLRRLETLTVPDE